MSNFDATPKEIPSCANILIFIKVWAEHKGGLRGRTQVLVWYKPSIFLSTRWNLKFKMNMKVKIDFQKFQTNIGLTLKSCANGCWCGIFWSYFLPKTSIYAIKGQISCQFWKQFEYFSLSKSVVKEPLAYFILNKSLILGWNGFISLYWFKLNIFEKGKRPWHISYRFCNSWLKMDYLSMLKINAFLL